MDAKPQENQSQFGECGCSNLLDLEYLVDVLNINLFVYSFAGTVEKWLLVTMMRIQLIRVLQEIQ